MVTSARDKFALLSDRFLFHPGMKNNGMLSKKAIFGLQSYVLMATALAWIVHAPGIREYGTILFATGLLAMLAYGFSSREHKDGIIFAGLVASMLLTGYFILRLGGITSSGGIVMAGPVLVIASLVLVRQEWTNWLLALFVVMVAAAAGLFPNLLPGGAPLQPGLNILFFTLNSILLSVSIGLLVNTLLRLHKKAADHEESLAEETNAILRAKTRTITGLTDHLGAQISRILQAIDQEDTSRNGSKGKGIEAVRKEAREVMKHLELLKELSEVESRSVRIRKVQSDFIKYSRFIAGEFSRVPGGAKVEHATAINQFNLDFDPQVVTRILGHLLAVLEHPEGSGRELRMDIDRLQENTWKDMLEIKLVAPDTILGDQFKKLVKDPVFGQVNLWGDPQEKLKARLLAAVGLVRILDGVILVKNSEKKGTTFRLLLPAHNASRFVGFDELRQSIDLGLTQTAARREIVATGPSDPQTN